MITMLDHDDEFLDGHLSALVAALEADPGAGGGVHALRGRRAGRTRSRRSGGRSTASRCSRSRTSTTRAAVPARAARHGHPLRHRARHPRRLGLRAAALRTTRFASRRPASFRWHADTGTSGGGGLGNFDPDKFARQHAYVRDKWADVYNRPRRALQRGDGEGGRAGESRRRERRRGTLRELERDAADDPDLLEPARDAPPPRGRARRGGRPDGARGRSTARRSRPVVQLRRRVRGRAHARRGAPVLRARRRARAEHEGARAWLARLARAPARIAPSPSNAARSMPKRNAFYAQSGGVTAVDQRQRRRRHRDRAPAPRDDRQGVRGPQRHHRRADRGPDRHVEGAGRVDPRAQAHAGGRVRLVPLQAQGARASRARSTSG